MNDETWQVEVLTPREDAVLQALALGLSNLAIGLSLSMAEATVKRNLETISGKMQISGRLAMVLAAQARGMVDMPGVLSAEAQGLAAYIRAYPLAMGELIAAGMMEATP